jgi:hypothetical protein
MPHLPTQALGSPARPDSASTIDRRLHELRRCIAEPGVTPAFLSSQARVAVPVLTELVQGRPIEISDVALLEAYLARPPEYLRADWLG